MIIVDFLELDDMRLEIIKIAKEDNWKEQYPNMWRNSKAPYEHSGFYVGRGITRFTFYSLKAGYKEINRVVARFREKYPEYKIITFEYSLIVYLRGEAK